MTLRTPRRRISPRAKRRCRVIRDFFRRALGSSSQQDIKINSSIAINVTDLKHKIVGIEHQLNEVSKHCQDLAGIETTIRKGAEQLTPGCSCQRVACSAQDTEAVDRNSSSSAKMPNYKPLETYRRKSDESDYVSNAYREERKHMTLPTNLLYERYPHPKRRQKNKVEDRLRRSLECENLQHRTRSTLESFGAGASYDTSSYHSLAAPLHTECPPRVPQTARAPHLSHKHTKQHEPEGLICDEATGKRRKQRKREKSLSPQRYREETNDGRRKDIRIRKVKRDPSKLDQDFITDLIQKQYKPTKVFDRMHSQISQFSVPVCRDQEFSIRESIQEGVDLCSCCYDEELRWQSPHRAAHRSPHRHRHQYHDCRSMCDARLYSSKRVGPHHYRHVDVYNDSTLYDVVPVKEKPSPKSRRKFVEDDIIGYEYYKEVPPSPRTHRPRLNLKAQHHADYEEYMMTRHAKGHRERRKHNYEYFDDSDEVKSELVRHRERLRQQKPNKTQTSVPIIDTLSNLQGHSFQNQASASANNALNKTQETDASDKTDKALCEIKDILQNFLQAIKKEAVPTDEEQPAATVNPGVTQVSGAAQTLPPIVPSYTVAQCSVPTTFPFTNPCCYPMPIPMCPMNCMPNHPPRSPSCTCQFTPQECSQKKDTEAEKNETEELIKEIYKFVTLNPQAARKKSPRDKEGGGKKLTSRSVGDSARVSRHDANVATSAMKCYSKSCEAIGSRMVNETSYTTQSDTMLEKLSLDVSRSDSDLTTEVILKSKPTRKITNALKSFFKKKKTDTESSSLEVDVVPRESQPPFRQDVYNYSMYGQYYERPPHARYEPPSHAYIPPPPGCEYRGPYYPPPGTYTPHRVHEETIPEHEPHYHHNYAHPSAPPYHDPFDHYSQQGPLCLKEVEVKSTGTQSERKMSFLRKLGRKTPPGVTSVRSDFSPPRPRFNEGTQTLQRQSSSDQSRPMFPGWKKFQEKVKADLSEDPLMYGYQTKQKLLAGDKKLKTAMMKKMFYKKNPFSPNNLIIRTLLGNDPSSYGEPNVKLKPRLLF